MTEALELFGLSLIFGALGGAIATAVAVGVVWLVLAIDRAVNK
jgi:hypothetical protein